MDQKGGASAKEKRPRDPEKWIHRPMEKYRKGKGVVEFRPDADFFALADQVVENRRTLLGYDRLYVFWQAIRNLRSIPGNAAEIGAYRGGSAFFIATAFRQLTGADVRFDVFDTFAGHPSDALSDRDSYHREPGLFTETSYQDVKEYLAPLAATHVHEGDILEHLPRLENASYRLVHIDTDLYLPTKACLEYFGSRLSAGGVVVVDDYSSPNCPGVAEAVVEYLEERDHYHVWDQRTKQLVLIRR
jgi:hypothetical protein